MPIALTAAYFLTDIMGIVCFCCLIRLVWECPERSRVCTAIAGSVAAAISLTVAVLAVRMFPESVYSPAFDPAGPDYDAFMNGTDLQSIASALLLMATPHIILKTKKILRILPVELGAYFAAEAVFGLISNALGLNSDNAIKLLAEIVCEFCVFLALTLFFAAGLKREHPLPIRNVIDTIPRWIYPVVMLFSLTVYLKDGLFDGGIDDEHAFRIFNVLWTFSILGIAVCAVYFVYKLFALSYRQNQILKQMNMQQENYENMLKSDEELRQFRHDYRNHMMVVTALLNSGRTEEASDYLETVKASSGIQRRRFSTGSFVADAVLSDKHSLAEEFAIQLDFDGRIPEKGVENADLCTVLGNLLDNAVEGAKRYRGDRYIKVEAAVRSGFLTISVANPVNEKVTIRNNRIRTTKSDARNHGIGLRNVERTATKYRGQMLLTCDENEFCADVSLKLEHPDDKENIEN